MTDKFHIRKALRVIDAEVDPEQVIFAVNPSGDQKAYIFDGAQLREIEFSDINNATGKRAVVVAGDVSAGDTDLERFSGTALAGTATTMTLPSGATESSDTEDFHIGSLVQLTGGTGSGQNQRITDYTVVGGGGSDRIITVSGFSPAPDATTTYEINCTNFRCDQIGNQLAAQWGLVRKPIAGQNTIDGDQDLYPYRIRIHPRIVDDESLRYESILFRLLGCTEAGTTPGFKRWEWLFDFKSVPSASIAGSPYLLDESPHRSGRKMTAAISDIVISTSGNPAWLEFTLTMTTEENGIAIYGTVETTGIS